MLIITRRKPLIAAIVVIALAAPAVATETESAFRNSRWDISLDLPVWPALMDLQPMAGGSFDSNGFGLGVSGHYPVREFANSLLLIGGDLNIAATDSSIPVYAGDMLARQMYLGVSAKWLFGKARNLSLDAGIGYHEVDIAQVDSEWWGTLEREYWGKERASGFIGATWDIGASRSDLNSGLFIGLRVHFANFGPVYDAEFVPPLFGSDAGILDGPMYMIRIGYSGR